MSEIDKRRASPRAAVRVTRRPSTRRLTTIETELWCVNVRSASSFMDCAGCSASSCRMYSWALLIPSWCSAARPDIRRLCTIDRIASTTLPISARASRPIGVCERLLQGGHRELTECIYLRYPMHQQWGMGTITPLRVQLQQPKWLLREPIAVKCWYTTTRKTWKIAQPYLYNREGDRAHGRRLPR